jgi:hypothetical protein
VINPWIFWKGLDRCLILVDSRAPRGMGWDVKNRPIPSDGTRFSKKRPMGWDRPIPRGALVDKENFSLSNCVF